jgi:hypothetical protein
VSGTRYGWMILAVICQCLVALMPVVEAWRTAAAWSVLHDFPGYDPISVSILALAAALLVATVIGLALSRSWGWSLAVIVNANTAGLFALGMVTDPRPPLWATRELVVAIVAIAVLLLPPVRTHYSRRRTPWILSWWAQPLNTGIDRVLVHLAGVAQVLLNTVFGLICLASLPYSGLSLFWPAAGIFVGVKLFSDPKLGRLLTLGWCIVSLMLGINGWISSIADNHNPARLHRNETGVFLPLCWYCLTLGLYLSLTVLKGWLDDMNGVSPSASQGDC